MALFSLNIAIQFTKIRDGRAHKILILLFGAAGIWGLEAAIREMFRASLSLDQILFMDAGAVLIALSAVIISSYWLWLDRRG